MKLVLTIATVQQWLKIKETLIFKSVFNFMIYDEGDTIF